MFPLVSQWDGGAGSELARASGGLAAWSGASPGRRAEPRVRTSSTQPNPWSLVPTPRLCHSPARRCNAETSKSRSYAERGEFQELVERPFALNSGDGIHGTGADLLQPLGARVVLLTLMSPPLGASTDPGPCG